jgi:hypothetical protein
MSKKGQPYTVVVQAKPADDPTARWELQWVVVNRQTPVGAVEAAKADLQRRGFVCGQVVRCRPSPPLTEET